MSQNNLDLIAQQSRFPYYIYGAYPSADFSVGYKTPIDTVYADFTVCAMNAVGPDAKLLRQADNSVAVPGWCRRARVTAMLTSTTATAGVGGILIATGLYTNGVWAEGSPQYCPFVANAVWSVVTYATSIYVGPWINIDPTPTTGTNFINLIAMQDTNAGGLTIKGGSSFNDLSRFNIEFRGKAW